VSETKKLGPSKLMIALLVGVPMWLMLSGAMAVFRKATSDETASPSRDVTRLVQPVAVPDVIDDLTMIERTLGERNGSSESAATALTRIAAWIDGSLGPSNAGYQTRRIPGPADWPLIHVSSPGQAKSNAAIWLVTSYDSPPGSCGPEANSSGLAATLAVARDLAALETKRPIHFAFIPHANDPDAPLAETAKALHVLIRTTAPAVHVLCIEAMGTNPALWITPRGATTLPESELNGIGSVVGAEVACLGSDTDLSSMLAEYGQPATRIATRELVTFGETNNAETNPLTVAESAARLSLLVRRLADRP
jgi:hypothetical protein